MNNLYCMKDKFLIFTTRLLDKKFYTLLKFSFKKIIFIFIWIMRFVY